MLGEKIWNNFTATILIKKKEMNIERCISKIQELADRIVVVDRSIKNFTKQVFINRLEQKLLSLGG